MAITIDHQCEKTLKNKLFVDFLIFYTFAKKQTDTCEYIYIFLTRNIICTSNVNIGIICTKIVDTNTVYNSI